MFDELYQPYVQTAIGKKTLNSKKFDKLQNQFKLSVFLPVKIFCHTVHTRNTHTHTMLSDIRI